MTVFRCSSDLQTPEKHCWHLALQEFHCVKHSQTRRHGRYLSRYGRGIMLFTYFSSFDLAGGVSNISVNGVVLYEGGGGGGGGG